MWSALRLDNVILYRLDFKDKLHNYNHVFAIKITLSLIPMTYKLSLSRVCFHVDRVNLIISFTSICPSKSKLFAIVCNVLQIILSM